MTLKTWLNLNGLSQKEVADELNISKSYFCQIVAGKRVPTKDIARKIEDFTLNKVSRMELLYPKENNIHSTEYNSSLFGSPLSEELRIRVLSSKL